jgi:hypothetical protein
MVSRFGSVAMRNWARDRAARPRFTTTASKARLETVAARALSVCNSSTA